MPSTRHQELVRILADFDRQIAKAKALLLEPLPAEELHRVVDVLVGLRAQRLEAEKQLKGAE